MPFNGYRGLSKCCKAGLQSIFYERRGEIFLKKRRPGFAEFKSLDIYNLDNAHVFKYTLGKKKLNEYNVPGERIPFNGRLSCRCHYLFCSASSWLGSFTSSK